MNVWALHSTADKLLQLIDFLLFHHPIGAVPVDIGADRRATDEASDRTVRADKRRAKLSTLCISHGF